MMIRLKQLVRRAKCVVLSALAATALGSTAFGDNSRVTAKSYVQKNLIAHWDGVNNDGKNSDGSFKTHNASATSWTDLVANRPFTLTNSSGKWNDTYLQFSGSSPYTYGRLSASDTDNTFKKVAANGVYEVALYAPAKGGDYWLILKSKYEVTHMIGASSHLMRNTKTYGRNLTPNIKTQELTATLAAKYCSTTLNDYVCYLDGEQANTKGDNDSVGGYAAGGTILGCRSSSSSTSSVTVQYPFPGKIYAVRLYDRQLSDDEIKVNAVIDSVRFYGNTADISTLLPTGWDIGDDGLLVHRFKDGSTLTGTAYDDCSVQFDAGATVAVSALPGENAAALTVTGKKAILKGNLAFTLPAEGLTSRTYTLVRAAEVVIPDGAKVTVSSASETFTCTPSVTATEIKVEVTLSSSEAVTARIVEGQLVYYDADGNVTTEPQGGMNDKITILFSSDAEYQALADNLETVRKAKGVALGDDIVLTADANWSVFDFDQNGHVIDLKGHKLTVARLAGDGEIADTRELDYELFDYIVTDGTQSIKTGCMLESHTWIDMSFRFYDSDNYNNHALFGSGSWGFGNYLFCTEKSGTRGILKFLDSSVRISTKDASVNTDTTVSIREGKVWVKVGTSSGTYYNASTSLSTSRELVLFAKNGNSGADTSRAKIWLYSMKVCAPGGTTVLRNFVPAKRKSDEAVGLLDLESNKFYTQTNDGNNFTTGTKTNDYHIVENPSELHVNVASGTTVENTTVTLSGTLKLVKDGAGTFVAAKTGQTYTGGTEIAAGKAVFAQSGDPSSPWSADQALFGANGSTITVDDGATLNVSGTKGLRSYDFVLAGGTLSNENFDNKAYTLAATDDGFGTVTLTADSTLLPHRQFVFNKGVLDLGGHTLTIDFVKTGKKSVFLVGGSTEADAQQIKNGMIRVVNNNDEYDYLEMTGGGCVYADTVTLDMVKAQLKLSAGNLRVRDYISEVESSSPDNVGNGILSVFGTFKPVTKFFYGCTLQDGATLDLSAQDGVWSTTSIGSCDKKTVDFADNATVTIVPQKSAGEIVNWEGAAPANLNTLKFRLAPGYPGRPSASVLGIRIRTWLKVFFL